MYEVSRSQRITEFGGRVGHLSCIHPLALAECMHDLNARNYTPGHPKRLDFYHQPHLAFHRPIILLDDIVETFALPDNNAGLAVSMASLNRRRVTITRVNCHPPRELLAPNSRAKKIFFRFAVVDTRPPMGGSALGRTPSTTRAGIPARIVRIYSPDRKFSAATRRISSRAKFFTPTSKNRNIKELLSGHSLRYSNKLAVLRIFYFSRFHEFFQKGEWL